jgi:nucleoside-diphosphate-sugar epimerase
MATQHNILITGASGFVGSNLLPFIHGQLGKSITSITRISINNGTSITYDRLFDDCELSFPVYIHLAGKAHDVKNISDESDYISVNYDLTKRLFDRFVHDEEAKTFIFVSSVKAVADVVEGHLTEDYIPTPISAYGRSKLMAEQYILDNIPCDRTVVILRPCMIHGPGNKGNLNLLHSIVLRGVPWPLGNFDNHRSFLSIDNLCYVIEQILNGNVSTGVYNLSDDEPLSTLELVRLISEVENKSPKIWNTPRAMIKLIAKLGNILRLPLNEERLEKLTENYLVSNQKIKAELRIDKMPMSAKNGMLKTLNSFKK